MFNKELLKSFNKGIVCSNTECCLNVFMKKLSKCLNKGTVYMFE